MKLLVIGNGSTGVDAVTKISYINNHTGYFLSKVNENFQVGFSQFTTVYNHNSNLQNYDITATSIANHNLPSKKHPLFLFKLIGILFKYDVIYIFYPGSLGTLVGVLARLLNKPYGLYVRGEYFNNNRFDTAVLNKSRFMLTISPVFVPKLKEFCNNVEVIKPMISIKPKDLKQDRDYYNYKVINLLFVGRVEKAKGINELIEIAHHLKNNKFNFKLDIIGGGDLYEDISEVIKEKGLASYVTLHGQIADATQLQAFYNQANVFVFPSYHEGFPRVLYEAMASALPIFTTFVGGIPGRMKHLDNCIEIPVKDAEKSAIIITKYLKEKATLEKVGLNGLKTMANIIDGSLLDHEDLLLKTMDNEK